MCWATCPRRGPRRQAALAKEARMSPEQFRQRFGYLVFGR
jgi:hypothetical protein